MNNEDRSRKLTPWLLFRFCPIIISPTAWWHCISLLYCPIESSGRLLARQKRKSYAYTFVHVALVILISLWCYIYWMITFDAGQYFTLLSSISSNQTTLSDGRSQFNQLIWRTALKTLFISIDFGLINACAVNLAALWRRRVCLQFYDLMFHSQNGYVLYETGQQASYDLPTHLTNDVRQFTSHLSITLFGSLFYSGLIAVGTVVVVFSIYIVEKTSGDTHGIAVCFGSFGICVFGVMLVGYKFNRTSVEQLKAKGSIRSFLQRLQSSAECIAFYASSKTCELLTYLNLNNDVHIWNIRAAIWYALVNLPLAVMGAIGGFVTYILPAILFFFLRRSDEQNAKEASKYLEIIAFYGYVFWLLSSLIWISESCLIAVTLGDRLWILRRRLSKLSDYHERRLTHDKITGIRLDTSDLIQFSKLRIVVPDELEQRVLQSNINLIATRGECVLISGPTGCGKTSLFRICAGLWPIDGERVRLPPRIQTIYVPQRPYLPIGSLRLQALLLLNFRSGMDFLCLISDIQIRQLFELVNMGYLIDRYDLDSIVEWSSCLSIGEQQRLSFIRLFALFTHRPEEATNNLVMLDESTSAIDALTESAIYELLNNLNIWFVTISHRPSLIRFHAKELKLYLPNTTRDHSFQIKTNDDTVVNMSSDPETVSSKLDPDEREIDPVTESTDSQVNLRHVSNLVEIKECQSDLNELFNLWKLIHLPFGSTDRKLRYQTYITWTICFIVLGCYSYVSYRLTAQTGAIFQILPDYAASIIDIQEARARLSRLIWGLVLQIIGVSVLYSTQIGVGQILASLYTRRQSLHIARLLLNDNDHQYTLYHASTLKLLPNILSHDLAEMNTQLFYLVVGSIYYNGLIGVFVNCFPYTILLAQQSGSTKGVLVIYIYQLFILILISCAILPYYRSNVRFENSFALLSNAQKRIDLQSEQIALSDRGIIEIEEEQLISKLDGSVGAQQNSGFFYGLLVLSSVLGNWSNTIINYAIPSAIFFHFTPNPTAAEAASIIALTVYTGYLQSNLTVLNSHCQPFSQVWTIGRRISQNLEQLMRLRRMHATIRSNEFSSGRRIEIDLNNPQREVSLALNNVNVCIPSSPSTILIRSLSFDLKSSSSLLISGSSGCGKSSLIRLLAGLEYNLTEKSSIAIPSRNSIIFLPQQLYLIEGTLKEQLNYFRRAKNLPIWHNDTEFRELLRKFDLNHLIDRYSFDSSIHLWSRTLSLGEQQRLIFVVALVGLLNSSVKCIVLDETTAGCDESTEKKIYDHLKEIGVQYISISHRNQLVKYHTHQLIIDSKTRSYQLVQVS